MQPPRQHSNGSLDMENENNNPIYENLASSTPQIEPQVQINNSNNNNNNPLSKNTVNTSSIQNFHTDICDPNSNFNQNLQQHQNPENIHYHQHHQQHQHQQQQHPHQHHQPENNNNNPQFSRETISTGQVSNIRKNFEFWGASKKSVKTPSTSNFGSKLASPMAHSTSFGFMPKSQSTTSIPEGMQNVENITTVTPVLENFNQNPGNANSNFGSKMDGLETTQRLEDQINIDNTEMTPSGMPVQPQYINISQDTRATGTPTLQTTQPISLQNTNNPTVFGSSGNLNQSLENTLTTNNTNTNTES